MSSHPRSESTLEWHVVQLVLLHGEAVANIVSGVCAFVAIILEALPGRLIL
jgi:hypothetical protein